MIDGNLPYPDINSSVSLHFISIRQYIWHWVSLPLSCLSMLFRSHSPPLSCPSHSLLSFYTSKIAPLNFHSFCFGFHDFHYDFLQEDKDGLSIGLWTPYQQLHHWRKCLFLLPAVINYLAPQREMVSSTSLPWVLVSTCPLPSLCSLLSDHHFKLYTTGISRNHFMLVMIAFSVNSLASVPSPRMERKQRDSLPKRVLESLVGGRVNYLWAELLIKPVPRQTLAQWTPLSSAPMRATSLRCFWCSVTPQPHPLASISHVSCHQHPKNPKLTGEVPLRIIPMSTT